MWWMMLVEFARALVFSWLAPITLITCREEEGFLSGSIAVRQPVKELIRGSLLQIWPTRCKIDAQQLSGLLALSIQVLVRVTERERISIRVRNVARFWVRLAAIRGGDNIKRETGETKRTLGLELLPSAYIRVDALQGVALKPRPKLRRALAKSCVQMVAYFYYCWNYNARSESSILSQSHFKSLFQTFFAFANSLSLGFDDKTSKWAEPLEWALSQFVCDNLWKISRDLLSGVSI